MRMDQLLGGKTNVNANFMTAYVNSLLHLYLIYWLTSITLTSKKFLHNIDKIDGGR